MIYSHLLFDFDNTLVDFSHCAFEGLKDTFKKYNIEWTEENYTLYKKINHQLWSNFEQGLVTTEDIRQKRFSLFLEALVITGIDGYEMNIHYLERIVAHPKILDTTIGSLDILHDKYTLGIVTNGLKEVQRRRIANHGLEKYFDHIVVSDEIDLAKPDPKYFQYAFDKIDEADKSKVLVIGDNITSDIGGAQSFGFKGCWFNPDDKKNDTGITPDYTVHNLKELVELVH